MIPHTPAVDAAKEGLSLALVAMIGGTHPVVLLAEVRQQLESVYRIAPEEFVISCFAPVDFLVCFRSRDLLLDVLHAPAPVGTAFSLVWRRWRRESMA